MQQFRKTYHQRKRKKRVQGESTATRATRGGRRHHPSGRGADWPSSSNNNHAHSARSDQMTPPSESEPNHAPFRGNDERIKQTVLQRKEDGTNEYTAAPRRIARLAFGLPKLRCIENEIAYHTFTNPAFQEMVASHSPTDGRDTEYPIVDLRGSDRLTPALSYIQYSCPEISASLLGSNVFFFPFSLFPFLVMMCLKRLGQTNSAWFPFHC